MNFLITFTHSNIIFLCQFDLKSFSVIQISAISSSNDSAVDLISPPIIFRISKPKILIPPNASLTSDRNLSFSSNSSFSSFFFSSTFLSNSSDNLICSSISISSAAIFSLISSISSASFLISLFLPSFVLFHFSFIDSICAFINAPMSKDIISSSWLIGRPGKPNKSQISVNILINFSNAFRYQFCIHSLISVFIYFQVSFAFASGSTTPNSPSNCLNSSGISIKNLSIHSSLNFSKSITLSFSLSISFCNSSLSSSVKSLFDCFSCKSASCFFMSFI